MSVMAPTPSNRFKDVALILDFGSVISYSVFERHRATEMRLGLAEGSLCWWGPLKPEEDSLWRDMLADRISERDYWARLATFVGGMVGQNWQPLDFLRAARSPDLNEEIRPEITRLVKAAKAGGARLGVLSNELELFYGAEALAEVRLLEDFDVIVDATHTKLLKPDPRAYGLVLDALRIDASRAVFLDDQLRNVAGGELVGLNSIFFDVRDPQGSCDRTMTALNSCATKRIIL